MSSPPVSPKRPGKNQRPCPAIEGLIHSADCGSRRGSQLSCPAQCPAFPFGVEGYDLWGKLNEKWLAKAADYLVRRWGLARFDRVLQDVRVPLGDERHELHFALLWTVNLGLFVHRNDHGRTLADEWEAAGFAGLNNDERVMTRYRRFGLPTILEVQRVLDGQSVQCQDLLEPDRAPFIVQDRSLAAAAVRFSRYLTWLTAYPYFSRIGPLILPVPHQVQEPWLSALARRQDPAGAGSPTPGLKRYLAENIQSAVAVLREEESALRSLLLEQAELHQCIAQYRLEAPAAEVEAILREKPEFQPEPPAEAGAEAPPGAKFTWVALGESAEIDHILPPQRRSEPEGTPLPPTLIGYVNLLADRLQFGCISKAKYDFAQRMLARYFGERLRLESAEVIDLMERMAQQRAERELLAEAEGAVYGSEEPRPPAEPAPQKPADEEDAERQRLIASHESYYRGFLDAPMRMLGGVTPRAAAADPQLRGRLIELVKMHLYQVQQQNRRSGTQLSLDGIVEALGLHELR